MLILQDNELLHIDTSTDYLEHYGVKGMKWGSRKMARLQTKYDKYREIAASRGRAIQGSKKDIRRARSKRTAVGYLLAGYHGAGIGALTVTKKNLSKSQARFKKKAAKVENKAARIAGKEAWKKSLDDNKINRQIDKLGKQYDSVKGRKVGLFDKQGRKQKKQELKDLNDRLSKKEDELYNLADRNKQKAIKDFKFR